MVTENNMGRAGAWAPFRRPAFAILWSATVLSNIGTWMHDVGSGWLMTELSPSPAMVAAVQAAVMVPVFLFAIPAGAIADLVDRRGLLISVNCVMALVAVLLALAVSAGVMTPGLLLLFTFLLGAGAAFIAPAWQAIVPSLVPRAELGSAIALNSMGINVSRAIGPAIAGSVIVAVGLYAPFALNALSFVGIILALYWWRPQKPEESRLPREALISAMIGGLRYVLNSGPVKATLARAAGFFLFASAFWAILPLLARDTLSGGPELYGLLMAGVGVGAVIGAVCLPFLKARFNADSLVAGGTGLMAAVLAGVAFLHIPALAIVGAGLAGVSWITVLSSLNVSAQTALPDWVRARGLSVFLTVFFGSMAAGSLVWGQVAEIAGIPVALAAATVGALLFIPVTWRAKLNQGAALDLTPAMDWPQVAASVLGPLRRTGPVRS